MTEFASVCSYDTVRTTSSVVICCLHLCSMVSAQLR